MQLFQGRLDVGKLQENGFVWDFLIVEHQTDLPHNWGEADILGTSQVVENNEGLINFCHSSGSDCTKLEGCWKWFHVVIFLAMVRSAMLADDAE